MPVLDLQNQLGVDLDRWLLTQSARQPRQKAGVCHAFEKDWLECSAGIGQTRARRECRREMEDLAECINMRRMMKRLMTVTEQRNKLIKEGKYTPPDYHSGKSETNP